MSTRVSEATGATALPSTRALALVRDAPPDALTATLTLDEVAVDLRVSLDTVRRRVRAGDIPAKRIGRLWRVDAGAYSTWKATPTVIDRHAIEPRSAASDARRARRQRRAA